MLHLSKSSCHHNDLQKSRIARDEADVQSLLTTMEGWVNPFQGNVQDLICLSTGKMASEDVAGDLLQAKHLDERAFQSCSKKRLEANPPKVRFHDSMSKAILKTFKHMNKKVELRKGTAKEIVLKADRTLFAQMIVIAEARQLSMKEVLSHSLGPLPWSLAAPDGSLKNIAKSSLAKELQKDAPAVESLLPRSACIIDGMAMVQRLKGITKSLEKLQRCYWPWLFVKEVAVPGSMLYLIIIEKYR